MFFRSFKMILKIIKNPEILVTTAFMKMIIKGRGGYLLMILWIYFTMHP